MALPTRTRRLLRQDVIKKFYRAHDIVVSTTTSGAQGTTTLTDTILSPTAEAEDYRRAYTYVSTQPAQVTSGSNTNNADLSAVATSLTVVDGTLFTAGDGIQLGADAEIMRVTVVAGNILTLVRGIQSTTATTHDLTPAVVVYKIGPAVGEVSRVTNVNFSGSTSTLTLLPALSCSLVSGQEYELHYDFHPTKVNELLDELLDVFMHPLRLPATLVADGAMMLTGTTNWAASVATLTKDTTYSRRGTQSLKVVATAANGQAQSDAIPMRPSTSLLVAALVYITSGDSAKLTLLGSATSGGTYAEIDTAASAASGWVIFLFTATNTSTQEYVKVYLESQANTDVTYWEHVIVWPMDQLRIPLPASFEYGQDIDRVVYFQTGRGLSATGDDNAYEDSGAAPVFYSHHVVDRGDSTLDPHQLMLIGVTKVDKPLWLEGWIDYSALASDSATTFANKDILVQQTLAELLDAAALRAEEDEKHDLAARLTARADLARAEVMDLAKGFNPAPQGVVEGAFRRGD